MYNELKNVEKVHFGRTMHCLPRPQGQKTMFFEIFSSGGSRRPRVKKKFQKALLLVFEVIPQPPKSKPTFEIGIFFPRFSSLCKDYLVHNMYITSVLGFPKCIIHVKRIKTSKLKYYKSTYKHVFSIR